MTSMDSGASGGFRPFRTGPQAWMLGLVYWFAFLMVLEPGNIFGSGGKLLLSHEIVRIPAAVLLGTSVTPLVLALVRRFPVEGPAVWRNAAIQLVASLALSAVLIVISCILADWLSLSGGGPFQTALRRQFEHNWSLVAFSLLGLIGFAHTGFARYLLGERQGEVSPMPDYLISIPVKQRGEILCIQVRNLDWIEAQGNYLALHQGSETHLIRGNLGNIESQLNPREFLRVHRGAIVALARVEGMTPLGSGDASLRLGNGVELRLSRKYRGKFLAAWQHKSAKR